MQQRVIKLFFEIISALILIPTLSAGNVFYVTFFILLINRVVDSFFADESVYSFYVVWHLINRWIGVLACALAFSMVYPGFTEIVSYKIGLYYFNTALLIAVVSVVVCDLVEVVHLDIRSRMVRRELQDQRRGASK